MKKSNIVFLVFIVTFTMQGQAIKVFFEKSDQFFKTYVVANKVDYQLIKSNPQSLDNLLTIASSIDLNGQDVKSFKAFWVNAYNLIVIKGIVDKYPVQSSIAIKGFFDKYSYKIAKQDITLKDIEKNILKSTFKDPLLNFVLVCGANGCPPLMDSAYLPDNLEEQFIERTKKSINSSNFIRVDLTTKTVEVSEIFDWYKEDFIDKERKILDFINKYRDVKIDESYTITYYKYDWSLNKLN
jgi:hypothetical protein